MGENLANVCGVWILISLEFGLELPWDWFIWGLVISHML